MAEEQKRDPVHSAKTTREVIQIDIVDFGGVFSFTAIDIFSRESDVLLRPFFEAVDCQPFLLHSMPRRFKGIVEIIQTGGGKEFETDISKYCNLHRIARPYKKNEQSCIESFNLNLRK
jgi:hypothetical protein